MILFIILSKVVLTCKSVDETLVCDHSNESYWAVLSCGTVYYAVRGGSLVCGQPFKWKLLSSIIFRYLNCFIRGDLPPNWMLDIGSISVNYFAFFHFTVLSIILKNNSPYELANRKNMKDILEGLLPYSGQSVLHSFCFPAKQISNWMALCKRDVSDFFGLNFFSFKSAWIFACAFILSSKPFPCIFFGWFALCFWEKRRQNIEAWTMNATKPNTESISVKKKYRRMFFY